MNQEHQKNHSKVADSETPLVIPPNSCFKQCLLELAKKELRKALDITTMNVFCEIRYLAWNKSKKSHKELLIEIGQIADDFHEMGSNLPPERISSILEDRLGHCTHCGT